MKGRKGDIGYYSYRDRINNGDEAGIVLDYLTHVTWAS